VIELSLKNHGNCLPVNLLEDSYEAYQVQYSSGAKNITPRCTIVEVRLIVICHINEPETENVYGIKKGLITCHDDRYRA
jgi:hypothetical protein